MLVNNTKKITTFCTLPFTRAKICADGRIHMCCHQSSQSYLGNLFEEPFEDLWFGRFAEDIRQSTRQGKLHQVCDTHECPFKYRDIQAEIKDQEANANGYPTELEFDLHGSHCNFGGLNPTPTTACIMCPRARPDFADYLASTPDRTDELIGKITHIVPYLKMINILGIAEPFWKDKIFEILHKFDFINHRDHIQVWTTSNASIFNEKRQEKFGEIVRFSDIHFSIDAATKETFLKIRQNDFFDVICRNVRHWATLRDQHRASSTGDHYIRIHNNINMLNVHETKDMVRLAKDLGADLLVLLPTHDCGGSHHAIQKILVNRNNYSLFQKAQEEATALANDLDLQIYFSRPLYLDYDRPAPVIPLELPKKSSGVLKI